MFSQDARVAKRGPRTVWTTLKIPKIIYKTLEFRDRQRLSRPIGEGADSRPSLLCSRSRYGWRVLGTKGCRFVVRGCSVPFGWPWTMCRIWTWCELSCSVRMSPPSPAQLETLRYGCRDQEKLTHLGNRPKRLERTLSLARKILAENVGKSLVGKVSFSPRLPL